MISDSDRFLFIDQKIKLREESGNKSCTKKKKKRRVDWYSSSEQKLTKLITTLKFWDLTKEERGSHKNRDRRKDTLE